MVTAPHHPYGSNERHVDSCTAVIVMTVTGWAYGPMRWQEPVTEVTEEAVWLNQHRVQKDLQYKTNNIAPRVILDGELTQSIYPVLTSVLTPILVVKADPVAVNGVPRDTASSSATSVSFGGPHHQTGPHHHTLAASWSGFKLLKGLNELSFLE